MYKLFLCLRFLFHRRIAIVPILAVMLCVAMDLIVTSLMGGFLDKVRNSVRGLFGDVIISNGSFSGFGYYDTYAGLDGKEHPGLLQYLGAISDGRPASAPASQPELAELFSRPAVIRQATPIIETYAVLRLADPVREGFTSPVHVLGIVPGEYAAVTNFQDGLYWQRAFPPGVDLETRAHETASVEPADSLWPGSPDFGLVPAGPGSADKTPLAEHVARFSPGGSAATEPVGIIVGLGVFWRSPNEQGRFDRQIFRSGDEKVQLTFLPFSAKGVGADKPEMKEFFMVDTAYSHIPQIDQSTVYVPFDRLADYLAMKKSDAGIPVLDRAGQTVGQFVAPARTTRVLVKFKDGVDLIAGLAAVKQAAEAWVKDRREQFRSQPMELRAKSIYYEPFGGNLEPNVKAVVWEEANKDYFSAISNQRFIALVMVGVVSLTVVALIWVIFIMIVVEKTKDIGIVKSVGGSAGGVAWVFLLWSAIIGTIGSALGGTLGWLFIRYINPIEKWLSATITWMTGHETHLFDPRAYLFDSIPARFVWSEMMWVALSAIVAAMLGALLPAWRAGRMNPVESLRYE